ncbi:WD40-repeat-containing domain protein [Armillaria mellea]|nr:WD40-repeat-containing domain protein [Armillaria mellea]
MTSHAAGLPLTLIQNLPSSKRSSCFRNNCLASLFRRPLDRVNVLGDEETEGHTGCVNALSWAHRRRASSQQAATTRLFEYGAWTPLPVTSSILSCVAPVIHTGHRANIFNARMLPHSSRIATVAGDKQVLVFDIGQVHGPSVPGCEGRYSETPTHTLRCHEDRVKRIVTEDSPDVFLTVSEDGTVRQHDLRTSHSCRTGCPAPLVQVDFELSSLAMSPLTPYQFVVAGDSDCGYLFDRRHLRTTTQPSSVFSTELTTCVRRFGRPEPTVDAENRRRQHITGARMSSHAGDEVLLAYNGDVVYRYSALGAPQEEKDTPTIMPIQKYVGAQNVDTVKDVNFLGPSDEYVTVGSDDGNFFVWNKESGSLHGIYEGDGSVVNVIEGHPHLPLVAVSGIDTTVKLFAPTDEESEFSRMDNAEAIIERNQRSRSIRSIRSVDMAALMQLYEAGQVRVSVDGDSDVIPCRSQ